MNNLLATPQNIKFLMFRTKPLQDHFYCVTEVLLASIINKRVLLELRIDYTKLPNLNK